MERIGKAIGAYSNNKLLAQSYYFELVLFCYLTGNNDMHLKNFSMINSKGSWTFAPAYDLLNIAIINPADDEELALSLEGKKKKLRLEHFIRLAEGLGLNDMQIKKVIDRFIKNRHLAYSWLERPFLSDDLKAAYKALVDTRYAILNN